MPHFSGLPLRTPRLLLRPTTPADAPALLALHADPEVMRYWGTGPWTSLDEAHASIARDVAGLQQGTSLRLVLERLEDAAFLGHCSLFAFAEPSRRAEVGYCLARDAWGKGLMGEALTALLRYGFEALGLNRVEADIDPRNAASARSLERLGFVREGLLRERWIVGAEVSDTALYGLLRADWDRRRAATARAGSAP